MKFHFKTPKKKQKMFILNILLLIYLNNDYYVTNTFLQITDYGQSRYILRMWRRIGQMISSYNFKQYPLCSLHSNRYTISLYLYIVAYIRQSLNYFPKTKIYTTPTTTTTTNSISNKTKRPLYVTIAFIVMRIGG